MAGASDYTVRPYSGQGYGPPNMADALYKMISGVPDAYREGQKSAFEQGQRQRTEELQKPVTDEQGKPITDYASALRLLMQKEGIEGLKSALPTMGAMEAYRSAYPTSGPSGPTGRNAEPPGQDPALLRPQDKGQPADVVSDSRGPLNIRQIAIDRGIDPDTEAFGLQFDPKTIDRPLSQGQVKGVIAKMDNLSAAGMGGPAGPTASLGGQPAPPAGPLGPQPPAMTPRPVQTVQAQIPRTQIGAPPAGPTTPIGGLQEAQAKEAEAADLRRRASLPMLPANASKSLLAQAEQKSNEAKQIREELAKYNQPTRGMREALPGLSVQESAAQAEAMKGAAAAKTKNLAGRIEGIRPAQESIQVLDEMSDAFRHGAGNISTGPGAQQWLKVKQSANNIWPGLFKGVPESEEVQKLNGYLSAAVVKTLTSRPTQYEFKAFQEQSPGLQNSRPGSAVLIDILRQTKMQELQLGRLADKFKVGGDKSWSEIEQEYFNKHPIISPQTHKPLDAFKGKDGNWYRPNPDQPGKFLMER